MPSPSPARSGRLPLRAGFTLVELLVVVGIIGILIAILIPTLGKARASSLETICKGNQKTLAGAVYLYANDNRGFIPTYLPASFEDSNRISSPQKTYRVAYSDTGDPKDVVPSNLGVLYADGYVDAPEAFYCPQQVAEQWQLEFYPTPYLSEGKPGENELTGVTNDNFHVVRSSYMYNPYPASVDFGKELRKHERLVSYPDDAVLTMDLLLGSKNPTVPHRDLDTWIVSFNDGHAELLTSERVSAARRALIENDVEVKWGSFERLLAELMKNRP